MSITRLGVLISDSDPLGPALWIDTSTPNVISVRLRQAVGWPLITLAATTVWSTATAVLLSEDIVFTPGFGPVVEMGGVKYRLTVQAGGHVFLPVVVP